MPLAYHRHIKLSKSRRHRLATSRQVGTGSVAGSKLDPVGCSGQVVLKVDYLEYQDGRK